MARKPTNPYRAPKRQKSIEVAPEGYTRGSKISQSFFIIGSIATLLAPVTVALGASMAVGAGLSLLAGPIWLMVDGLFGTEFHEKHKSLLWGQIRNIMASRHNAFDVIVVSGIGLVSFVGVVASAAVLHSFVAATATLGAFMAPAGAAVFALTAGYSTYHAFKEAQSLPKGSPERRAAFREAYFNGLSCVGAVLLTVSAIAVFAFPPATMALAIAGGVCLMGTAVFKMQRLWRKSQRFRPFVMKRLGYQVVRQSDPDQSPKPDLAPKETLTTSLLVDDVEVDQHTETLPSNESLSADHVEPEPAPVPDIPPPQDPSNTEPNDKPAQEAPSPDDDKKDDVKVQGSQKEDEDDDDARGLGGPP